MSDTLLRQWAMLRHIPRAPHKTDTTTLREHLMEEGFLVEPRTIQRDLKKLSLQFALVCDERSVPHGWSWMTDSQVRDIAAIDPSTALTFMLVERFMAPLLPPSVLQHLRPHLHRSGEVLNELKGSGISQWPKRIQVVPPAQPLVPAEVAPEVLETVYSALLYGRRIKARYHPRDKESREYEINPLGLVVRPSAIYLVCTLWEYLEIKQFALHRFQSAESLDKEQFIPEDFDLNDYIDTGGFFYPTATGGPIRLSANFTSTAAFHLHETPLSDDQQIELLNNDLVRVTASVTDTQQLRWWLLGFGSQVEVLDPPHLRAEFVQLAQEMASLYDTNKSGNTPKSSC